MNDLALDQFADFVHHLFATICTVVVASGLCLLYFEFFLFEEEAIAEGPNLDALAPLITLFQYGVFIPIFTSMPLAVFLRFLQPKCNLKNWQVLVVAFFILALIYILLLDGEWIWTWLNISIASVSFVIYWIFYLFFKRKILRSPNNYKSKTLNNS